MRETEIQAAITGALLGTLTEDSWVAADPYLLRHLAAHAAAGELLGELAGDAGFMVHAEPARLLDVLGTVSAGAHPLARVYWRAANHLRDAGVVERADILRTVAVQDEPEAVGGLPMPDERPLGVRWAKVARSDFHRTLIGHKGPVNALAFTALPDGTPLLASGGDDHVVRLWDPVGGAPHTVLARHTGPVNALAALELGDGLRLLASGGADRLVHLWDPATATHVGCLEGHAGEVRALAAVPLPDGDVLLAAGDGDGVVCLWEPSTGWLRTTFKGHFSPVRALDFTVLPDGTPLLAVAGNTVCLWDIGSGHGTVLRDHLRAVNAVAFVASPDGAVRLASADTERVILRNAITTEYDTELPHENSWLRALTFTTLSDGTPMMAGVIWNSHIRVWDPEIKKPRATFAKHTARAKALAFGGLPGGATVLASAGADHTIRLWDPVMPHGRSAHQGIATGVNAIASTTLPGGPVVVAGAGEDGTVRVWEAATGRLRTTLSSHNGRLTALAFIERPDGAVLLAGVGFDNTLLIWDVWSGDRVATMTAKWGSPRKPALMSLPDDTVVAVAGPYPRQDTRKNPGTADGAEPWNPRARTGHLTRDDVRTVTFLEADHGALVLASEGIYRTLALWDRITAGLGRHLTGVTDSVVVVTGLDLLVSAGKDSAVRLWDLLHPERRAVLTGHTGWVTALACASLPGGKVVLASGGYDGTVRLWDPVTARASHVMPVGAVVHALTFAGPMLVAGTARGVVVFDVDARRL